MSMQSSLDISPDHASFAGHFPKFPVLPGAVLLDEVLQAVQRQRGLDLQQWKIASAKFLAVVRPGDALQLVHEAPKDGLIRFTIAVADRLVASGTLSNATSPVSAV